MGRFRRPKEPGAKAPTLPTSAVARRRGTAVADLAQRLALSEVRQPSEGSCLGFQEIPGRMGPSVPN